MISKKLHLSGRNWFIANSVTKQIVKIRQFKYLSINENKINQQQQKPSQGKSGHMEVLILVIALNSLHLVISVYLLVVN